MGSQLPVIAEKPFATCGCRKFQLDPLGDHLNTCTAHSGAKKAHDWMVDQHERELENDKRHKQHQVHRERRLGAQFYSRVVGNVVVVIRPEPRKANELEEYRHEFRRDSNANGLGKLGSILSSTWAAASPLDMRKLEASFIPLSSHKGVVVKPSSQLIGDCIQQI